MWLTDKWNFNRMPVDQHSSRRGKEVRFVTIHYSVGGPDAVKIGQYFKNNPNRKASYHFGISAEHDPDDLKDQYYFGFRMHDYPVPVVQYVDTDRAAWSSNSKKGAWTREGKENPNYVGINIVLANWGFAQPAKHHASLHARHAKGGRELAWEVYDNAAIYALANLINRLEKHHNIEYICGHEDHVYGKVDPGPAFPWSLLTYLSGVPRAKHNWKGKDEPGTWELIS